MRPGLRGSLLFLIFSATIFSGVLAVAASEITPPARQKTEVPNAAALRDARKRVNDVFADEIARAKTVDQKTALAKKMLAASAEMKNDSDARYVLLGIARDLALAAGDFQEALAAVSALDQYEIDGIRAKTDVLATASKSIQSPGDALTLVGSIDHVIDEALAAGRYDVAFQLAKLAASAARLTKDADALSHATTRLDDVREIEAASVGAKKAAETLAKLPHDPDAKLALGRFEGFLKGRWETSLPLLAEGSDAGLKSLAQSELDHPADASKQLGLADGWWALAEKEKGLAQRNIRAHAAQCYATALPNLTGLAKAKAEKRVKEWQAAPSVGWVDLYEACRSAARRRRRRLGFQGSSASGKRGLTAGPTADRQEAREGLSIAGRTSGAHRRRHRRDLSSGRRQLRGSGVQTQANGPGYCGRQALA
ncbi:MAG: hypothetical protein JWN24_2968 [Phycisphaerales bacterium]|nr:hypothetical protein [Phycisphaerales bacterium]